MPLLARHLDDDRHPHRQITPLTRREIFDYIRTDGGPWWGRLDEVDFLARVYDLEALPSTDYRFETASGDIWQHRVNNLDWDDAWVFSDSRFELASGADEVLLEFLAQMVHPVVQPGAQRAREIAGRLNELLAADGWVLKEHKQMSGRPVYAPARTGTGTGPAVSFAHAVATRVDTTHISQQLTRMEGAVEIDPELAIGTAKEFVESICKAILDDRNVDHNNKDDLPALVKKSTKALQLTPADVAETAKAAATIKKMLNTSARSSRARPSSGTCTARVTASRRPRPRRG